MTRNKLFVAMAALAGTLLLGAAPAAAAQATTPVNVRAGAGTSFAVVDVLARGEHVDITRRSGGWCYVQRPGPDGWVSCRYLTDSGLPGGTAGRPDVNIQFSIPGFSFSIGDGGFDFDRPGRPDRPDRRSQVCFYEHVNYQGDRFCARPGERIRALGAWNDRISSIRVSGFAEAQVCEHNGFRGRCAIIDRNVPNLGRRGNDIISSIRVR
jgi:uncharacterized protein YraI